MNNDLCTVSEALIMGIEIHELDADSIDANTSASLNNVSHYMLNNPEVWELYKRLINDTLTGRLSSFELEQH